MDLLYAAAVLLAAYFIRGIAGFGSGLVAVPLLALTFPLRQVVPLMLILDLAARHEILVTLEENAIAGGAGSGVAELLSAHGVVKRCLHLGLPDRYVEHAEHHEQLASVGLDAPGLIASLRAELERREHGG